MKKPDQQDNGPAEMVELPGSQIPVRHRTVIDDSAGGMERTSRSEGVSRPGMRIHRESAALQREDKRTPESPIWRSNKDSRGSDHARHPPGVPFYIFRSGCFRVPVWIAHCVESKRRNRIEERRCAA
jgi:hypothetical protein